MVQITMQLPETTTVTLETHLPANLHQEVERLVDVGWYNDTNDVLLEALRRFLNTHRVDVLERHVHEDVEWGLYGRE
jgi:Arc/MetJ-type ribon-helix-helix transcriptional regulator